MGHAVSPSPRSASTTTNLVSVAAALGRWAALAPERTAYVFLADGEEEQERLTYAALDARARAIAAALHRCAAPGDRALLLYPPGLDFVAAFFGCLYAGVVAVPAYPPRSPRMMPRLRAILDDAQPAVALVPAASLKRVRGWLEGTAEAAGLSWLATDEIDPAPAGWEPVPPESTGVAFLQYTSGSTSTPKGVMVTHENLLHNQEMIRRAFGQDETSVIVGWLPLYHDMGLIGNVLQPLYVGARCILMSPHSFLRRPLRWLEAISRHGGTTSGGPNFAYDLCARKVSPEDLARLDLTRWNVAFNGAEPVRPETLARFAGIFAPAGFRREAFYPCYGLAEATLFAAGGPRGRAPEVRAFEAPALERNRAVPVEDGEAPARRLVGCGHAWMDQEIAVVDPGTGERCAPGQVGEIWISGPSVARGYWGRKEQTLLTFGAGLPGSDRPFLRTGDLGVISEGELFVTGRLKDLIILRGRNLYPQDIELTIEASHPALRSGSGAAFPVEVAGEERLVVVQEVERRQQDHVDVEAVAREVRRAVAEEHEAQVHEVVLLEAGAIPKTSSGKIQRHACRAGYLEGSLATVGRSAAAALAADGDDAPALDRGTLLALDPAARQAAVEGFIAGRVARLTGLPEAAARLAAGRSLVALGLDSLGIVELRNALEAGLGVEVPLTVLFQGSGVAEISALVLAGLAEAAIDDGSAGAPATEGERPLTAGQRGLWLLDRVAPERGVCNLGGAARVRSPLDPEALRRALVRLARRHPALRTVFGDRGGKPWQRVEESLEPGFAVRDASGFRSAELEERLLEEIYRPFDLEHGPLLRAAVWTLAPGEAVLSLAVHHLVADLWSLVVLLRDLGALYEEESGGAAAELPPLPLSPAGFSRWQERLLSGERGERLRSYWSGRLAAPLPAVELPADRLRPPRPSFAGSSLGFRIPAATADRLRELARQGDATLYTVLLGALLALVHRQTGQEDLIAGSPTSGRTVPGCEPLVGYLVNPVALRASVDGGAPFASLLAGLRESVPGAFEHQDYPFPLLAERLEGPRDASRSPIFQLAFVFQKPHLPELAGLGALALGEGGGEVRCGGLRLESVALPQARVQYDLTLVMAERDGALGAAFQYATDLFDRTTVARLASQLGILLEGVAADPRLAVRDLPLLTAAERQQLAREWNAAPVEFPDSPGLHEIFAARAVRSPEAVAVVCEEERLSYGELERRANQLARHLIGLGVRPGGRVGLCLERSVDMLVSILGVLKAGSAYVPFDPAYPRERLAFLLEDSRVPVLLAHESLAGSLPEPGPATRVVFLDRDRERIAGESAEAPAVPVSAGHPAYVIYTSGSTGRPKGVVVRHGSAVRLFTATDPWFGFGPEDVWTLFHSYAFDFSVWEIWGALLHGGRLVVVPWWVSRSPEAFYELLRAERVTVLNQTPSAFRQLIWAEDAVLAGERPDLALRWVIFGGEALELASLAPWFARHGDERPRLVNMYGITETTVHVTYRPLAEKDAAGSGSFIGQAIPDLALHVLDRAFEPQPVGVPGEIHVGGAGLAPGYLGRPELTAERFVPNPHGEPGSRLYRSGDLARYRPDGDLEYLGRIDHQVKIRGFRVEPGEIESALAAQSSIREAVVLAREHGTEKRLVAYLVPAAGESPSAAGLREHLRQILPEHMVPAAFVILPALPLTENGKVDRKALPAPEAPRGERTAPRTPLEERLAALWSDVLGVAEIGVEESFFDLGGHSLLAMRVISRIREELGVAVEVRTLFERPTVAALAAALAESGTGAASPAPPLRPVPRDHALPLSFAQKRLWFLHQLMPGTVAYNIPAALRLSGRLDPGALRRTFEEIARRQESLRTAFRLADGRPVQWIGPAEPWPLSVADLSALGPEAREREARHRAAEEAALPFDLAAGPLFRTRLLRLGPEEHVLVLAAHHAIFDGWSLGILSREMGALYPVLARGNDGRGLLPALPVQYADFAVWQRQWLADGELDRQLSWWRERLAGSPALLDLPADRPRPKTATGRGGTRSSRLEPDLAAALHTLGRGHGATLFMALFAGWAALLHRYTGETDLVVGTPVANRPRAVLEDLIGLFVNSLPLRTSLDGDPAFLELLGRVRESLLGAQAHQDLPFEKLVEALAPQRSTAHTPLFQVLFVLQNAPFTALELPGLALSLVEIEGRTAQLDLSLSLVESGPEIEATLEFNRDLFDPVTADRLLGHLEVLLAGAVEAPEVPLTELPLLTPAERWQLEAEAGGAGGASPEEGRLDRLFDEQAERTPEAVALVCDDLALTYAELRARAEQLARHLAGIAPEAPVAVCLESSPELVVSLLAVWKAGGTYLPLDPAYPPERLAFMVEDAEACAVLTSARRPSPSWAGRARVLVAPGDGGPAGEPPPRAQTSSGSLAWIIYTSGSTGRPKGVGVEHGAAADHMGNVVAAWGLGRGDRVLQISSPSFDMSLEEIVAPLLCGATVVLRGSDFWEPSRLLDRAAALGLTVLNLPTAYWQQWIRECEQAGAAAEGLPLRLVVVGGEAVPAEAARRWRRTPLGHVRLLNGYGPTEAVISASFHEVGAEEAAPDGSIPIGLPLPGRSGWVLDRRGIPVPAGVPGELHLGGRSLARGYPGRPDLTAERFVPDPFSAVPGSRLYRTGDRARRLPTGPLSFLGRTDRQVKVRGFRIEPAEVEAALARHSAVREAVVLARELAGGQALVAYVTASGTPPTASELRDHARASLPDHMVPSAFVLLDSLPLTPSSKVDRRALPAPEIETERGFVAPRTPVEELLAGLWAELLNVARVGAQDHFFELGGHSLLATQMVSRLRSVLGVDLPVRAVFEHPTVAGLTAAVEEALRSAPAAAAPPLVPAPRRGALPLSFAQERLWFLDRLEPESPAYNLPALVRFAGRLDGAALQRALDGLAARHEPLRTTFRAASDTEERPLQVIAPEAGVDLPGIDLATLPEAAREAEARRLAREEAVRPFDLRTGPLLRTALLRLGAAEHALLVTFHHIVSDGWSLGVFARELSALYGAAAAGAPSVLPALPVQYADWAVWQRHWLTGEVLERQLAWWRERLAGAPASLDLPTDRPRTLAQGSPGGALSRPFAEEVWSAVETLARRESATPFLVVLAALQTLLARYSGEDDVTVGSPIAGRNRLETEGLIGLFVNTLVLRGSLADGPSFRALLARARETALGAHAHQDLPFESLVEKLAPERRLGQTPLFQVMLTFQNTPALRMELPELRLELSPSETGTSKLDLTFTVEPEENGGAGLEIRYRSDLFDGATAGRMLGYLETLLAGAAADPGAPAAGLPLLTAAESAQVEADSPAAEPTAPSEPVPARFAAWVRRTPEAPAVVSEDEVLTYGEVADRASRLARALRGMGVGPEERVALFLERSADLPVAILGIFAAGGAYVPLDREAPGEHLAWQVADSGARVLVTREALRGRLAGVLELGVPVLAMDRLPEGDGGFEDGSAPEHLAYVLYTSGSTGRPKGVAVEHRQLAAYLDGVRERMALPEGSSYAVVSTPAADLGHTVVFPALTTGGTLHVVSRDRLFDAAGLAGVMERHRVDCLKIVPSHLATLLAGERPEAVLPRRLLVLGGEALERRLVERVRELAPGCRVLNHYGPTETTVGVLTRDAGAPLDPAATAVPLGRPLAGTHVRVTGRALEPQPAGVPGELLVGGAQVARGYLGRPGLTAERFVPDPFASRPGARLYRTGDRARRRPGGEIEFLGRIDHQVKVRGFRIEPEGVAAVLAGHPAVRQCAVIAREDLPGGPRLVAYFVAAPPPETGEIRSWLRERLPEHMVPAAFVVLEALPLTPNGKIDRKALPAPEQQSAPEGPVAPRTPTEEIVAALYAELLGVPGVGREDSFFDLGGHSLLATRVISRVRSLCGAELPVRALFERPTVAELAAAVEEARRSGAGRLAAPPLVPVPRKGDLPLSFAQERLWFIDQLEPGTPLYNMPVALRIEGPLDARVLALCLGEIRRRHEPLRTIFAELEGTPVQVIEPAAPFALPLVDLSGLPRSRRETVAVRLAEDEAGRPFDLTRGPLLRGLLVRLAGEDHVAALTLHHIASDGWSMRILVREVTALYAALAAGKPSPLPELPVQYADFSAWQRSWLSGETLESEISFWREQLAGLPPLLDLPTDRPRPAVQSFRGASRPVRLPAGLTRQVQAFGRREGATLFMTLLAAFQALLARYSGQDDLAVGAPIAGRNRLEIEGLIGFFVNTLVLRADLAGPLAFRELLGRVRETALAAHAHQDVPFEKLVQDLSPERSLSHSPLFQVMLVLQNTPAETLEIESLRLQPAGGARTAAKFDLTLDLREENGELRGVVEYSTDLFDAATLDRLAGHFERLLAAAVAAPERSFRSLPLLSPAERGQILVEWNDTAPEPAPGASLHGLFEAQVRRTPEAVALVAEGREIRYRELDREADRLAGELGRHGAGPETVVGVHLERSAGMVTALLAILKAGAAYLPLDPNLPSGRLEALLTGGRVSLVVGEPKLADKLPWSGPLVLLPLAGTKGEEGDRERGRTADPENLAYVLFTSGSTGTPKGVAVTHRSAVELVRWAGTVYAPEELAGVLASTSLAFDLSVFEIFVPLAWGGTVILARNVLELPALLSSGPAAGRVTLLNTVPSAVAELVDSGSLGPSVRTVNLAGEPLPRSLADRLYATGTVSSVWNLYGPSEDTTYSTFARVPREDSTAPGIGRPVAGTQAYVLAPGAEPEPLPVGVAGELYLGGAGLARGYLHRPELTAERFVPDPFGGSGGRLYRTGDLVRRLNDGSLEFLGRLDHQVKVRGFRIELGEIEAVLASLPGIREAVVVVWEGRSDLGPGDRRLVAYVAGEPASTEVSALRQSLRERLPDYMVPSAFVALAALPLTPNGKIDRKALPAPEQQSAPEGPVAPRTPTEEIVAALYAELLGVPGVGREDGFFDLGGHSLLATRVVSRLRNVCGAELPVRALFEKPTVAELAAAIEEARRSGAGQSAPPLVPVPRTENLPLSFAQERLWFLDQLEPGTPLYNMPVALRIEGPLDTRVLALCLGEIRRRHEPLRTIFAELEGTPVQVIEPAAPFALPLVDLSGLPRSRRETVAVRLAGDEADRPFDLTRGPLLRGLLVRLAGEDHVAALTLHHIASDGWSMRILVREVTALYAALAAGKPSPLPELPVQYADFSAWQRSWLSGETLESEISFWREQLAGLPPLLDLPTDRPRPAVQSFRGASRPVRLPAGLTRQVQAFGRREGATLFMTLLAAFQALLTRYSGQDDLAVGAPVAGRNRLETEGLIGFFVNTLVLRADLTGPLAFRELLGRVRETALAAHAHQDVPFEKLVQDLSPERSLSHSPLFQVMLALQNTPAETLEIESLRLSPAGGARTAAKFDLTLNLEEQDGELRGVAEYSTDLFDAATLDRLAGHFERLLAAAVAAPERSFRSLPLLSPAERGQILVEWNDTAPEPAPGASLHGLFEEQVRRTPEAVALIAEGREIRYRELDREAGRLAGELGRHGAGPETVVGVHLERSAGMVTALLAILKAGAAYLPLDPNLPPGRLEALLTGGRVSLVVGEPKLADKLPWSGPLVLLPLARTADGEETRGRTADPENLAYVLFTSGSTGTPKGVAVTHRSAVELVRWAGTVYAPEELAGVLASTSLAFDLSVFEIFVPLAWGGTVILARNVLELPALLSSGPAAGRVTLLNTVPSAVAELADSGSLGPSVRTVNLAGEPLPRSLADRLYATGTVSSVWNLYGPSEDTTYSTFARVPRESSAAPGIGRPVAGTQAHVLAPGAEPEPLPVGVAGELYLGGAGLARGYLHRPELTAERFVPDPFGGSGGRLYRTGDLVRRLNDGSLEFLGRLDHQVKVRGFRIELGEIEAVLASLPGIREAVAVVRESRSDLGPGDRRLVAYVAGDPASTETSALRRSLRERLPDYMVPSAFVALAALPLTSNGKIDRKALPAPEQQSAPEGPVAPRTPTEEIVAALYAELLGVPGVGREDGFFDLGGHSLLATRVVSRLRSVCGVELPVRALFEKPTVAELAAAVEEARRGGADRQAPPLVSVPCTEDLPLSFSQERLWLLAQIEGASAAYNIPCAVHLAGALNPAALAHAVSEVVRRHEALRTRFTDASGEPRQVIDPPVPVPMPVVDVTGVPEAEALRLAAAEAVRPFDLTRPPLLRTCLLRRGAEDHLLVLILHHIAADGWSLGVLVDELAALYRGEALEELPLQYADFAVWQRRWLAGETLEQEVSWWRERLAGAPEEISLLTDRPRPLTSSGRGEHCRALLPPTSGLASLGRERQATLFMVLLAAFSALLSRWSGDEDLVVGSPVANRNWVETEGLIGFFVNMLPLRVDLSGQPGFAGLLARVREATLAAYAHQDLPFEKLVEALQPARHLGRTPLFQVSLMLQNAPFAALELPDLSWNPQFLETKTAKFDLSLSLTEEAGGLVASLEHRTDLFERTTALRLLSHFETLLRAAVANPGLPLQALPLLSAAEAHQLRSEWNDTAAPFAEDLCLHDLVFAQARRTPRALAVRCGGERVTYADLAGRARRLAGHLRGQGIGCGDRVGLAVDRSEQMVVALLGILAAGAAYVPLDPTYPRERLDLMIRDARPVLLLTEERLADALPQGAPRFFLERAGDELAGPPVETAGPMPGDLAYVLYTSGSTGRPKGVAIPHRAVVNFLAAVGSRPGLGAQDAVLALTTLSFDIAVLELFLPLVVGGTVVVASREVARSGAELRGALADPAITVVQATPATWRLLLESGWEGNPRLKALCGGEALPPDLADSLVERCGELWNMYGPTETTVWSMTQRVVSGGPGAVPVGRPLGNTDVHLLDRGLSPVAIGLPGELWIGGASLALGYLGRPDLTAAAFRPDPFAAAPGARLYRTGDLARRLPDGAVEFLGRIDHQVKVRGFRIELGEIEAALSAHPAVRAAVVVVKGKGAEKRLVAYFVPSPGAENPGDLLRAHLRESLPDYMVPAAFVPVESLPLTPSGKIDRQKLAASGPEPLEAAHPGDAPRTTIEDLLAGIWAEVLGVERVSIHDGFFDLGGHSLLATRVVSRLRDAFGIDLPLRVLFERPSVAELAEHLDALTRQSRGLAAPPLQRVSRSLEPPLSFAQQSLWVSDQMKEGNTSYNGTVAVELQGRLDLAAFAGGFRDVAERHEILRTSFALQSGEPRQVIQPEVEVPLPLADLTALPESRRAEALEDVRRELRQPFDFARAPLLRSALLRFAPDTHALVLCQHHIISDAWSMGILVHELAVCYEARLHGRPAALPPLPVQYADWSHWQRQWLRGDTLDQLLAFWRRQLGSAPPAARPPAALPAPAVRTSRGGRLILPLPAELEPALRTLARKEGVTLFMLLLGVFEALLHRSTGQEDLVLVVAVSGRDRLETEGLIGCFLNMLPLRASLAGDPSFKQLLHRVRETCLDAFAHQDLPFERLVGELRLRGADGRSPFQVAFGVRSAPAPLPALPELAVRELDSDPDAARLDLTLWITESPEGLSASWTYSADLFERGEVERLHGLYEALLAAVVANPEAHLRDLALSIPRDREGEPSQRRRWEDLKKRTLRESHRRSVRGGGDQGRSDLS